MYCVSVSYKNAELNIRKKLGFSETQRQEIYTELLERRLVSECVLLCTCNRTEVYFCGEKGCEKNVIRLLAEKSGIPVSLLSKYVLRFFDDKAISHLFKVCCGIDSMILGEDEILGQTKKSYYEAMEHHTVSFCLNKIFQSAFSCAKRIKTETALSNTSVSAATLAANEAAKCGETVNVLIIGASGKIGSAVLKNLVSHKNIHVRAAFRKHNEMFRIAGSIGAQPIDYHQRYDYMNDADCIISSTASPHYTVTLYDLKNCLADDRPRLFIDLAVPPDIDEKITQLNGVRLLNIDYFETLAKENNVLKLDSVEAAKQIIIAEMDDLKKELLYHSFMPELANIKQQFTDRNFEKLVYKMKSETNYETFSDFIRVLKYFED